MTSTINVNTIIVGGGHAGVNLACMLKLASDAGGEVDYLILERSTSLLSKWRDKRWDHFQLNTPVGFSRLHGQKGCRYDTRDDWLLDRPIQQDIECWDAHINNLGIMERCRLNSNVISVKPCEDGTFETIVEEGNNEGGENTAKTIAVYNSKNLVVCNGVYDHNIVPSNLANAIPGSIKQHVSAGFKLEDLMDGNVLVVGSSQSGIQLSNILVDQLKGSDRRQIYLACSAAGGCPRSYRGHDIFYWFHRMKFLYIPKDALANMPPEKVESLRYGSSGSPVTGPNKAISPFSLERKGVVLTGRLKEVSCADDTTDGRVKFRFNNDRCESLQAAKDGHSKLMDMVRDFATKLEDDQSTFEPEVPEAEWEITNESLLTDPGILSLDVKEANITNVIWACGWDSNLTWLNVDKNPLTNDDFNKRTKLPDRIVSEKYPGLFFAGYPWIGTLQSMNIVNMDRDAKVIIENLV